MTGLPHLPPELVEEISSILDPTDLRAVRLTCNTLNTKTFSPFWRGALRTIKTDLSLTSLQRLSTISSDSQLRRYVQKLTIRAFDRDGRVLGKGFQWERHSSGHLINLHKQPAVQQFDRILCHLINCNSIQIETTSTEHPEPLNAFTATDAIMIIMNINKEAGLTIRSFTLDIFFMGMGGGDEELANLDPRRLQLSEAHYVAIGANLEELDVRYKPDSDSANDWPLNVMLHAPELRKLRLACHAMERVFFPIFTLRLALMDLPCQHLQELEFFSIYTTVEYFIALLRKFKQSLRALKLQSVRIESTLDDLKQMFRAMGTFPALEIVNVKLIDSGPSGWRSVHFPAIAQRPVVDEEQGTTIRFDEWPHYNGISCVEYSGENMKVALNILAGAMEFASGW
ncbi:F-box protein [Aspergillus glaucus CBS 516.65]|uniref:F-box domain-containing protein n=1 Tax=Aspergillus glaucus CBS 516.65 TaxID=1160497 RepID=A0A1L9VL03_ASPGL|nr:hypothetical protein ASPGLDRAFT_46489 [Aspergillus glaucus CBS 516.65]OJJ84596.1 hypothetical protein ASPGLDRAFT_46489 [Aspergillus glaucus CBS 516.65]